MKWHEITDIDNIILQMIMFNSPNDLGCEVEVRIAETYVRSLTQRRSVWDTFSFAHVGDVFLIRRNTTRGCSVNVKTASFLLHECAGTSWYSA